MIDVDMLLNVAFKALSIGKLLHCSYNTGTKCNAAYSAAPLFSNRKKKSILFTLECFKITKMIKLPATMTVKHSDDAHVARRRLGFDFVFTQRAPLAHVLDGVGVNDNRVFLRRPHAAHL